MIKKTTDDVLKRIIVLFLLLYFLIQNPGSELANLISLIGYLIVLITIILLGATQIEVLKVFIPENVLEKAVWIVIFLSSIGILIIQLLSSIH